MLDYIARPLGIFLKFIYDTIAFHNYGLSIIVFTLIVRLAMLPLTLKQYKSTAKMQELQPLMEDIKRRYKDDKEKLNQEMMKLYQEHNYNPAGGCLPMLIQMPIILSLYWVIVQPLKFMLGKSADAITKIVQVAGTGLGIDMQKMGSQQELLAMNYFSDNPDALSQVSGLLDKPELIDFTNFLGLHLGRTATYQPNVLFGPEWGIYVPLLILVILATVTTYISTKLTMPKTKPDAQNNAMGCSNNTMMYMGPVMTLIFSFQLPAGVILYWMIGYVVAIFQQMYINKHILKRDAKPDVKAASLKKAAGAPENTLDAGKGQGSENNAEPAKLPEPGKPKNSSGGGQKGNKKKGGKKK